MKGIWFLVAVCVSFGLPASMIVAQWRTLEEGELVKVRTRPMDPYDPFRGRYVRLGFDSQNLPLGEGIERVERGASVFVVLDIDESGFARFQHVLNTRPNEGNYIRARVRWANEQIVNVRLPFERYYMNEKIAPSAERAYRELNRARLRENSEEISEVDAYVLVRVRNGKTAIEGVYIKGERIEDYVKQLAEGRDG